MYAYIHEDMKRNLISGAKSWIKIRLFANFGAHSAQLQNSLRKFYIKC